MKEDERDPGEPGERDVAYKAGYVKERRGPEDGVVVPYLHPDPVDLGVERHV